ncbi:YbaB/EbfC family nucleoid-associated protein [Saccharopolyspora sp. NPDC049357]|uniref:YbaB/EbfC family nucleoid-associated protein n=1 Tax=Saccharopolyspora sp. NPDC049357 TaxID=3154507 RepID=UPI00344A85BE
MTSGEEHEARLAELRSRLAQIRQGGSPNSSPGNGNQEFTATAGDGAVRVDVRARRLARVDIASGLMGQPRGEVSKTVREAINQAMARARAESPQAGDPAPNLGAIGDQLADFARQSGEQLRRIQGAVEQNMDKLGGQIRGDASPQHVDFLFDDALELVRSMQSALAGNATEPITGEGRDESDEVEAVVSGGELTELTLTGYALQMMPGELSDAVCEAVNDAFEEWEERAAGAQEDVDVEALQKLGERAETVRSQSMQHFRNYTDSMTSIMRNAD